ncbi:hypothetical protein [Rhodoferax sp.]|nr:hypothetical protein [Rhodoferax sp.]
MIPSIRAGGRPCGQSDAPCMPAQWRTRMGQEYWSLLAYLKFKVK